MMFRLTLAFTAFLLAMPALVGPALADGGQIRVVVPSHDIPRGATIGDSDLSYTMVASVQSGVVTSMNDLDGMQTRRYLRAGETVRADDVRVPVIITKGMLVTMTFNAPGITLTATGKAMSEGGIGESITIVNPVSYRQISATVTGPGMARADSATVTLPNAYAQNTR
jgi:flagella basal body P-ring formation protein FlgA